MKSKFQTIKTHKASFIEYVLPAAILVLNMLITINITKLYINYVNWLDFRIE